MTPSEISTLREIVAREAYASYIAAADDVGLATLLNTASVAARRIPECWEIRRHAIESGYWVAIKDAQQAENAGVRAAAISAVDWLSSQDTLGLDLASTTTLLGALVLGGVMTEGQRTSLLAIADTLVSPAAAEGLPTVTAADIEYVRTR